MGITFAEVLFAILLIFLGGLVVNYLYPSKVPLIVQILELYENAELALIFLVIVITSVIRYIRQGKVKEGAGEKEAGSNE